jgi:ribosome-binding protein aMBF1 (putative translation factor)
MRPQRATAMPSHRILRGLATLGWSERELARPTGRHQTTVRRWTDGTSPIDADVAAWLETLERFYRAHPAPRLAPMLRPAKRDQHQ